VISVRVADALDPASALAWLHSAPAGATALVVTTAKGTAVRCVPSAEAEARLRAACERALSAAGATRALAWHASGVVAVGGAVAVVGAVAEHRKDALAAVDVLLAGLKGVAAREDVP
jgi:molybdopterin synthase catalytic subunit